MRTHLVRASLAVVTVLALVGAGITVAGTTAVAETVNLFTDDDGNIHEGNIQAIAVAGITKGCNPPTSDRYCPSGTVTRGQIAAFLVRALGLAATGTDYFSDDDGTLFEADINKLAEAGITRGGIAVKFLRGLRVNDLDESAEIQDLDARIDRLEAAQGLSVQTVADQLARRLLG